MFRQNRIKDIIRHELCHIKSLLGIIIPASIISGVLIIASWIWFGGPCRVSILFRIPGAGLTIALYYLLWFLMFLLFGGECAVILDTFTRNKNKPVLLHIASHLCLFLWYPLFFTTFSQFLALLVLIAAIVLLIIEITEAYIRSLIITLLLVVKVAISLIFFYINFAFLVIN